jgi:hypothetical protein
MVVEQTHAVIVQSIDVRSFEDWISVAGEIAVALIVSDDEDDVGAIGSAGSAGEKAAGGGKYGEGEKQLALHRAGSNHGGKCGARTWVRANPKLQNCRDRAATAESLNPRLTVAVGEIDSAPLPWTLVRLRQGFDSIDLPVYFRPWPIHAPLQNAFAKPLPRLLVTE